MESLSSEIFNILRFLLPGFLTAWIFYAFTATPKPSQFERIIQALIYTIFIQGMVFLIHPALIMLGHIYSFGAWTSLSKTIWLYVSGAALGFIFSVFANNDKFHSLLRILRITKQTSYHCEWYGAFHDREGYRVILTLINGKRVYGYPWEWPSDPTKGHFVLTEAAWIDDKDGESIYIEMPTVDSILFRATDVQYVAFIKEDYDVEKSTSTPTEA